MIVGPPRRERAPGAVGRLGRHWAEPLGAERLVVDLMARMLGWQPR
jgi:hypothetical protein